MDLLNGVKNCTGFNAIYTQNKLVCENLFTQCIDFEYYEDIIFLKENYRHYIFLSSINFIYCEPFVS